MSLPSSQTVDRNRNEGEVELNGSHFLQEVEYSWNLNDRVVWLAGWPVSYLVDWWVGWWVRCLLCFNVDDLTWFLVCCCALSLLLGCRGVSLGIGPIGVGCGNTRKQTFKT